MTQVLETFSGIVDDIENGIAFVTLTSLDGDELTGQYSEAGLVELGIKNHRRFICRTVENDGVVEVQLEAIPDAAWTVEDDAELSEQLAEVFTEELDGDF